MSMEKSSSSSALPTIYALAGFIIGSFIGLVLLTGVFTDIEKVGLLFVMDSSRNADGMLKGAMSGGACFALFGYLMGKGRQLK